MARRRKAAPTVFTVALSNTSFENVVLDLQGTGVSATSGVDFEVTNFRYSTDGGGTWTNGGGANGTQVTIPAGTASILVEIDTLNDAVYEGDETFSLSVNSVVSGTVGSSADTGTGTITDAADIPDVTIGDNTVAEGGLAIVSVDLSNASTEAITLDLGALGRQRHRRRGFRGCQFPHLYRWRGYLAERRRTERYADYVRRRYDQYPGRDQHHRRWRL